MNSQPALPRSPWPIFPRKPWTGCPAGLCQPLSAAGKAVEGWLKVQHRSGSWALSSLGALVLVRVMLLGFNCVCYKIVFSQRADTLRTTPKPGGALSGSLLVGVLCSRPLAARSCNHHLLPLAWSYLQQAGASTVQLALDQPRTSYKICGTSSGPDRCMFLSMHLVSCSATSLPSLPAPQGLKLTHSWPPPQSHPRPAGRPTRACHPCRWSPAQRSRTCWV